MEAQVLYIIGNGFDLHHGIPSGYDKFASYLKNEDIDTYNLFEEYFSADEMFWWEFETRLADFDSDTVMDQASQFLMSYGAEDWSDSGHHDYEYEIERVVEGVSTNMLHHFGNWIRSLSIPDRSEIVKLLNIDPSSKFLTFNYTPTLRKIYDVPNINILHIHGYADNSDTKLVLGHGWTRGEQESYAHRVNEDTDTRVAGGYRIIDGYFSDTFKPTAQIISQEQSFFSGLSNLDEIRVLGHSLAEVDEPYFDEILKYIDLNKTRWKISYHQKKEEAEEKFSRFGIQESLVTYAPLTDFQR